MWSKQWKGVKFLFQLLELGYEKFPHNTTGYTVSHMHCPVIQMYIKFRLHSNSHTYKLSVLLKVLCAYEVRPFFLSKFLMVLSISSSQIIQYQRSQIPRFSFSMLSVATILDLALYYNLDQMMGIFIHHNA